MTHSHVIRRDGGAPSSLGRLFKRWFSKKGNWSAAALLALGGGLVALGFWVGRRRPGALGKPALDRFAPGRLPFGQLTSGQLDHFAPAEPQPASHQAVLTGTSTNTSTVGTTPTRIVLRTRAGVLRRLTISTDQPIRIGDSAQISDSRGFYLPSGVTPYTWPDPLRPEDELWATRATNTDASVTVLMRTFWRDK